MCVHVCASVCVLHTWKLGVNSLTPVTRTRCVCVCVCVHECVCVCICVRMCEVCVCVTHLEVGCELVDADDAHEDGGGARQRRPRVLRLQLDAVLRSGLVVERALHQQHACTRDERKQEH